MQAVLVVGLVMQQESRVWCRCLDFVLRTQLLFLFVFAPLVLPTIFCTINAADHTMKKANSILELLWKYNRPCKLPEGSWRPQGSVNQTFIFTGTDSIRVTFLLSPWFVPEMVMCVNYFNPQICSYMKNLSHSRKCVLFNLSTLVHLCCSVASSWELIKVWAIFNSIASRGIKLHFPSPRGV